LQALRSEHALQAAPFLPQAAALAPATQLVPFQQPVQQAPAWQVPEAQLAAAATGVCVRLLPLQPSTVQSFWSSQLCEQHTAPRRTLPA
jgi:hypothetical protein